MFMQQRRDKERPSEDLMLCRFGGVGGVGGVPVGEAVALVEEDETEPFGAFKVFGNCPSRQKCLDKSLTGFL